MKVESQFIEEFGQFITTYCPRPSEKILKRVGAPFRSFRPVIRKQDLVRQWNARAQSWCETILGSALNLQALLKHLELNRFGRSERILFVGSGLGIYETFLACWFAQKKINVQILCVDSAFQMTRRNQHLIYQVHSPNVQVLTADAASLPFASHTIDHVVAMGAIQWMPDWRAAIKEMIRVLAPKGQRRIFLTVYEGSVGYLYQGSKRPVSDANLLSVEAEFRAQGFRIEERVDISGGDPRWKPMVGELIVAKAPKL